MKKFSIDLHDYKDDGTIFFRTAARAIVRRDNKILCIHSKYGDYKFPGGGQKENESIEQTLLREVQEETGYHVIPQTILEKFIVTEKRKGQTADIMIMDSHYFICDVEDLPSECNLDDYEKEYNYKADWLTLEEIILKNEQCKITDNVPWIIRDKMIFEQLYKELTD